MGAYLQWTTDAGLSKALYFDVTKDETQEFESKATEHPVEDGANIADHVRKELNRVTITVFVSNSPIEDVNSRGSSLRSTPLKFDKYTPPLPLNPLGAVTELAKAGIGAIGAALFGGPSEIAATVLTFDSEFDAVEETLATLESLRDTVQLIDVVTPKRLHEAMFLEKIHINRNDKSGDGADFELSFRELRKVKVSIVGAPTIPKEVRANTPKNKGAKAPTPAKGPQKSILKSASNLIPKAFGH